MCTALCYPIRTLYSVCRLDINSPSTVFQWILLYQSASRGESLPLGFFSPAGIIWYFHCSNRAEMMGGPPSAVAGEPPISAYPSNHRGCNVLLGLRFVQRRLPAVVPPIIFSLLLLRPAIASVVSTRQLETNEVVLNAAQRSESAVPWDSSSELATAEDEAPSGYTPSVSKARRPNVTSRDEGSRRHRPADIRCYCNLPRCVSTGYMCKSASGACFSDLADRSEVELATHGCIELLPSTRQEECQTAAKVSNMHPTSILPNRTPCPNKKTPKSDNSEPSAAADSFDGPANQKTHIVVLLLCCHLDMCNHIDSPEIHQRLTNGSGPASAVNPQGGEEDTKESSSNQTLYFGNVQDGWFRVATIAVPICGAFILMLLIFLAFKILRTDSEEQKLRGQRHKQCCHSSSHPWDEEDLCLHHHHCQDLLSSDIPYLEENCQLSGCRKGPSGAYTHLAGPNPINAKVHLLPPRPNMGNPNAQKKSTKFNYLFLFPRSGKSEKQESGKMQQYPSSGGTTKAEVPAAMVVVSAQGRRDQI